MEPTCEEREEVPEAELGQMLRFARQDLASREGNIATIGRARAIRGPNEELRRVDGAPTGGGE